MSTDGVSGRFVPRDFWVSAFPPICAQSGSSDPRAGRHSSEKRNPERADECRKMGKTAISADFAVRDALAHELQWRMTSHLEAPCSPFKAATFANIPMKSSAPTTSRSFGMCETLPASHRAAVSEPRFVRAVLRQRVALKRTDRKFRRPSRRRRGLALHKHKISRRSVSPMKR